MINFVDYTNQHYLKWLYIPYLPYRILIIGIWLLINNQPDIDKIYLYQEDPYEVKYQYLKSGSHLPKKSVLFASMLALKKWWKTLFISS